MIITILYSISIADTWQEFSLCLLCEARFWRKFREEVNSISYCLAGRTVGILLFIFLSGWSHLTYFWAEPCTHPRPRHGHVRKAPGSPVPEASSFRLAFS